jgi:predicted ArsR family transcriptional regulator
MAEKIGSNVIGHQVLPISQCGNRWDRNEKLRKAVVSLLNENRKPMCVEDVAEAVGCAWVTAKAILSDLALEGKVKFFSTRQGYGRLYQINEEWITKKAAEKEVGR